MVIATDMSMAFRVREDESVAKGLRRVFRKELDSATDCLTGDSSSEAIHEARKSIKKVRSVLQLVGDALDASRGVKHIREASHLLSPIRDAEMMIETAKTLGSNRNLRLSSVIESLRSRQATLAAAADRDHIRSRAAQSLDRVRRKARDWHWDDTGFSVLATAITRSYTRARNGLRDVREDNRPDTWHEWRKRVKTLWYALRLLERRTPPLRRQIADLKRLETALGEDHNLFVLHEQLASESTKVGWPARARLHSRIERRQRALRRQAIARGVRLFAQPPKVFAQHLRKMWKTQRKTRHASIAA
jgi:hypothetical protein